MNMFAAMLFAGIANLTPAVSQHIEPQLRSVLDRLGMTDRIVEWMARRTLPERQRLKFVLKEEEFNLAALTNAAAALKPRDIPPIVSLAFLGEVHRGKPVPPSVPGRDYPGLKSESVFTNRFHYGFLWLCPETRRNFAFRADTWPVAGQKATFRWSTVGRGAYSRDLAPGKGRAAGYADVETVRSHFQKSVDVAVQAKYEGGDWGPPSFVTFYAAPDERRTYHKDGKLESIAYPKSGWTDYYRLDERGRLAGFERRLPTSISPDRFSNLGELILERWPNDAPRRTVRVRYSERDGALSYEREGEEILHPLAPIEPRVREL